MTEIHGITETELEAIRSVEQWISSKMQKDFNAPSGALHADTAILSQLLNRLAPAPPVEEVASRPGDWAKDVAAGLAPGPIVVDRGAPDIKWRWAKEAVGLTALELNEAYAEFSVTEDGWSTPNGKLHSAAERLQEVMQRLGITGDEIPF